MKETQSPPAETSAPALPPQTGGMGKRPEADTGQRAEGGRRLLDLFCGKGGWSKAFIRQGWECTGVDLVACGYPGTFIRTNVLELQASFIDSFDAVVSSPPCEEFARAWLPWLRGDKRPAVWATDLLCWSVRLTKERPRRITECSRFAARHVSGAVLVDSYALWGDVPAIMPQIPRTKARKSGLDPAARAEIPPPLADWIAAQFTKA